MGSPAPPNGTHPGSEVAPHAARRPSRYQGENHMLHVSDLSKAYGDHLLFERVSFVVNAAERVGLVGPNGCGKTTLLRILAGQDAPDTGSARYDVPLTRVGYLPQAIDYGPDDTVRDVLAGASDNDPDELAARIERLAGEMGEILGYMDKLNELNTDDIDPMMHAQEMTNVYRDDEVKPSLEREEALRNAPRTDGEYFLVPRILEQ